MLIKGIITEDFVNYKKPCMTIIMPFCDGFKCGAALCQNSDLAAAPIAELKDDTLIKKFNENNIAEAICFQGLEPFDSADELFEFIKKFRIANKEDIVIYTGYTEQELEEKGYLQKLKDYGIINIILKVGRYIPNEEKHYDDILGVYLASNNQYGLRLC